MPVNEPLLREAVSLIELSPEQWFQGNWIGRNECGTTFCLAGYALLAAGLSADQIQEVYDRGQMRYQAAEVLGLDQCLSGELFYFTEVDAADGRRRKVTLDDLKWRIAEVTGVEIKIREDVMAE